MKTIRQIITGIIVGGAFGAKLGAYLLPFVETSSSIIQAGLALGSFSGFLIVLAAVLIKRKTKKPTFQWSAEKGFIGSPF